MASTTSTFVSIQLCFPASGKSTCWLMGCQLASLCFHSTVFPSEWEALRLETDGEATFTFPFNCVSQRVGSKIWDRLFLSIRVSIQLCFPASGKCSSMGFMEEINKVSIQLCFPASGKINNGSILVFDRAKGFHSTVFPSEWEAAETELRLRPVLMRFPFNCVSQRVGRFFYKILGSAKPRSLSFPFNCVSQRVGRLCSSFSWWCPPAVSIQLCFPASGKSARLLSTAGKAWRRFSFPFNCVSQRVGSDLEEFPLQKRELNVSIQLCFPASGKSSFQRPYPERVSDAKSTHL